MSRKFFWMFLAAFVLGCSFLSATKTPQPTQSIPMSGWTAIIMNQSGGIMGLSRSIQISSDGKFTVTDERLIKKVDGALSVAELSDLNQKIAALSISSNPSNGAACADCFVYDLDIQGNGKTVRMQLNDVTLPGSGFEPLVTFLRELGDKSLE